MSFFPNCYYSSFSCTSAACKKTFLKNLSTSISRSNLIKMKQKTIDHINIFANLTITYMIHKAKNRYIVVNYCQITNIKRVRAQQSKKGATTMKKKKKIGKN